MKNAKRLVLIITLVIILFFLIINILTILESINLLTIVLLFIIIFTLKKITSKPIHLIFGISLLLISIIIIINYSFNWTIGTGFYYIRLKNDVSLPNIIFFYVIIIFLIENFSNLINNKNVN